MIILFRILFASAMEVFMESLVSRFFKSKMGVSLIMSVLGVLAKRTDNTLDDEVISAVADALA